MVATVATHPPSDWASYTAHFLSAAFWRPSRDRRPRRLGFRERVALATTLGEWVSVLHAIDVPATLRERPGPYDGFPFSRRAGLAQRLAEWGSLPDATGDRSRSLVGAAPAFVDRWLLADPSQRRGLAFTQTCIMIMFSAAGARGRRRR